MDNWNVYVVSYNFILIEWAACLIEYEMNYLLEPQPLKANYETVRNDSKNV